MPKCEICKEMTDKLYTVHFTEEWDSESGPHLVPYDVCSMCVPDEAMDFVFPKEGKHVGK